VNTRQVAHLLGRNQGPEFFFQQAWSELGNVVIPKAVNLNRPLERFHMVLRGRVVIATNNMASTSPEALQNLIQNFKVTGTHSQFKSITPINMSGADCFAWPYLFRPRQGGASSLYINGTRVDPLGVPAGLPLTTFGNTGTYDFEVHYDIQVIPVLPAAAKVAAIPWLWQQKDWGDSLQIQLQFGDHTSLGTPNGGGTAFTFSAFGSGSGSPQVTLFTNYEILGALANQIQTAVVIRSTQNVPSGILSANSNTLQRLQLLQKQRTLNVMVKSGTLLAGTSQGVTAYATLSDVIFDQTQVIVDNKPVRNNFANYAQKEYAGYAFDTVLPQGYLNFPFLDSMNPLTAYPADQLSGGSTFEIDSAIIGGAGGVIAEIVQEQYLGTPGITSTSSAS
jgi:hypothetical protein